MRTLSETAQGDIVKLIGGLPWAEVIDLHLPDDFTPTATEASFVAVDPDGGRHILISNLGDVDKVGQPETGWTTSGQPANYKWFFAVPYQRDNIEDSSEQRGAVNTRISIGDTGGVIKAIVDRCDGLNGLRVDIAMVLINPNDAISVDGTMACHAPDVIYSFNVGSTTFDGVHLSCTLTVDSPIEWKFPPRAMLKNVCHFAFKSVECGFTGMVYFPLAIARTGTTGFRKMLANRLLLSRGYIEQMASTGQIATTPILPSGTYVHLASGAPNDFYAVLAGNLVYWNGTSATSISFAGEMESETFPVIEKRLTSGAAGDGYCLTATNVPRYLYYLQAAVATQITIGNFPIAVHSETAGEGFAIKASAPGDDYGDLYILSGATSTLVDNTLSWDWLRHLGEGACLGRANGRLYHVATAGGVAITEIKDAADASLPAASLSWSFRHDGQGAKVVRLDVPDGDDSIGTIFVIDGATATPVLTGVNWLAMELADWDDWFETYGFAVADEGVYRISIDGGVWTKELFAGLPPGMAAGLAIANEGSLYVLAGDGVYLTQQRDYLTCNHTLADCKDRGNQVRFGGFPGIGTGGLTK